MIRFSAAIVVVFMLMAPYLANLSRDYTRYCYYWRTTDTLCVGLLLLGVAVLTTLAGELVRRTGRPALIIFNHLFLAAFGVGVLANLKFTASKIPHVCWQLTTSQINAAWILLALLVGYSLSKPQLRILLRCRQVCQILLPVVPVTFVSLLWSSTYPVAVEPILPIPQACSASASGHSMTQGGIYVFLFDEWSYERTFADGVALPQYPHLADFARTATVYHKAYSPAPNTETSVPAILLQTPDVVEIKNGWAGFHTVGGALRPARDYTSLFDRPGMLGYHTAMIGSAMPYRLWLGERVDLCRNHCIYSRGDSLWSQLGIHVFNAMHYAPDPWTNHSYKHIEKWLLHGRNCSILKNVHSDVRTIVREWPSNTLVFAHVNLPHFPAVLKSDLSFCELQQTGWREDDLDQYEANLTAMDAMLGDFVTALQQAGKYDDATIVLTSDHTWRTDPDWAAGRLTGPKTHVPLLVKAPRQDRPACVDERFETKNLGELIESIVRPSNMGDVFVTENRSR